MKLTYIGREEEVCVPMAEGQPRVKRGHSHDFESDIAKGLLRQTENWKRTPVTKRAAKKPPAKAAPATEAKGGDKPADK